LQDLVFELLLKHKVAALYHSFPHKTRKLPACEHWWTCIIICDPCSPWTPS